MRDGNRPQINNGGLFKGAAYALKLTEAQTQELRTRIMKERFLAEIAENLGVIKYTCEKVGIERTTYYKWMKLDPEFAEAVRSVEAKKNDKVEDVLMAQIRAGDGPATRFYLERKHPEYRLRTETKVITGSKTLEDLLKEDANKRTTDTGATEDQGQAGAVGAVPFQRGTAILLAKENPAQSDTQSAAEGAVESDRR
jgi:hypothetical protein